MYINSELQIHMIYGIIELSFLDYYITYLLVHVCYSKFQFVISINSNIFPLQINSKEGFLTKLGSTFKVFMITSYAIDS